MSIEDANHKIDGAIFLLTELLIGSFQNQTLDEPIDLVNDTGCLYPTNLINGTWDNTWENRLVYSQSTQSHLFLQDKQYVYLAVLS